MWEIIDRRTSSGFPIDFIPYGIQLVQDDVIEIDSVNSGGSVQLESTVSASHGLDAIVSTQESELVMTM